MIIGLGLTGIAGFVGGIWKSYNDIPSLIGYMSMALIFYQVGVKWLNIPIRFHTSGILYIYLCSRFTSGLREGYCHSLLIG